MTDIRDWSCARWLVIPCLAFWLQWPAVAVPVDNLSSNTTAPAAPTNSMPAAFDPALETNSVVPAGGRLVQTFTTDLAAAYAFEKNGQPEKAEPILIGLLGDKVPDSIRQTALFELEAVIRMENDLPRAVSVCAQFLDRWPNDPRVPEILLRQGQIYRQMGLNNLALTKFYAVMTAALSLKSDRTGYYPGLVLEAQIEIAETHYLMGRFNDAAEFYSRLITQNDPALNHSLAQFRLIRSLMAIGRNEETASQAQDFLGRFPGAPEQPEVRFYLAQTLKLLGRNNDALEQVLLLLREEKATTQEHPERWAYWQQRAGNEVANQLYREGDYIRALDIYINLAQLDPSPAWQLPVKYQIGLTYERLLQPQKAVETYNDILKLEPELGTNATPSQKSVFEMARWRGGFLGWQNQAETSNRSIAYSAITSDNSAANTSTNASVP